MYAYFNSNYESVTEILGGYESSPALKGMKYKHAFYEMTSYGNKKGNNNGYPGGENESGHAEYNDPQNQEGLNILSILKPKRRKCSIHNNNSNSG